MNSFYHEQNKINLLDIPDNYSISRQFKGKLSVSHSALIEYVANHFQNTNKYKRKVCNALNIITYCVLENEVPPFDWTLSDPLATMPDYDMDLVKDVLSQYYLDIDSIEWNIEPHFDIETPALSETSYSQSEITADSLRDSESCFEPPAPKGQELVQEMIQASSGLIPDRAEFMSVSPASPTPKEHLFLRPWKIPRFSSTEDWWVAYDREGNKVVFPQMLPKVPECQRDITFSTDLKSMTDKDFMKLYPNQVIRTRRPIFYEPVAGLEYDEVLGVIYPIQGFTTDQIKDNLIRYPHLFDLRKIVDPEAFANNIDSFAQGHESFAVDIEIDGELLSTNTVWDSLPESKVIPRVSEYVIDYVIRRYLLERDHGVIHKYPMFGSLEPFITVFMPPEEYIKRGYTDTLEIVKQCVRSRMMYHGTRNPALKRVGATYNV